MLGTIIGDIIGSAYEFSGYKGKAFSPLFHPKSRFTDDTICTVGVAQALLDNADPATTLIAWCDRYAENGGWGRAFAQWFTASKPTPYGSWGNGGAMRVSPVGFLATSEEAVITMSDAVTNITHNHPEAVASAQAVALAVFWARQGVRAEDIAARLAERYGYPLHLTPDDIRPGYKRTERASDSVPQAISCALHAVSYEDAIRNAVSLGGDSDTIAAIAGGIAEARFGIPDEIKTEAWTYLPADIREVVTRFYEEVPPITRPRPALSPELLQAFKETLYTVHHKPPFSMEIGVRCEPLRTLMATSYHRHAAFITAWNPFSQPLTAKENATRQVAFVRDVDALGLAYIEGIGQHPSNNWPGEHSLLVLGIDEAAAKKLAATYGQHAFVWATSDAVPVLLTHDAY